MEYVLQGMSSANKKKPEGGAKSSTLTAVQKAPKENTSEKAVQEEVARRPGIYYTARSTFHEKKHQQDASRHVKAAQRSSAVLAPKAKPSYKGLARRSSKKSNRILLNDKELGLSEEDLASLFEVNPSEDASQDEATLAKLLHLGGLSDLLGARHGDGRHGGEALPEVCSISAAWWHDMSLLSVRLDALFEALFAGSAADASEKIFWLVKTGVRNSSKSTSTDAEVEDRIRSMFEDLYVDDAGVRENASLRLLALAKRGLMDEHSLDASAELQTEQRLSAIVAGSDGGLEDGFRCVFESVVTVLGSTRDEAPGDDSATGDDLWSRLQSLVSPNQLPPSRKKTAGAVLEDPASNKPFRGSANNVEDGFRKRREKQPPGQRVLAEELDSLLALTGATPDVGVDNGLPHLKAEISDDADDSEAGEADEALADQEVAALRSHLGEPDRQHRRLRFLASRLGESSPHADEELFTEWTEYCGSRLEESSRISYPEDSGRVTGGHVDDGSRANHRGVGSRISYHEAPTPQPSAAAPSPSPLPEFVRLPKVQRGTLKAANVHEPFGGRLLKQDHEDHASLPRLATPVIPMSAQDYGYRRRKRLRQATVSEGRARLPPLTAR